MWHFFIRCATTILLSIFLIFTGRSQDSSHLRISLLTCSPGEELYSIFGHSAIRVIDSSALSDYVYNYGTFNFDDEGFYLKFIRGKLLYYVSLQEYKGAYGFQADYEFQKRGIVEQVLNLTPAEKISTAHFLRNNLKQENRYYKYDFFLDNCTTRLRDIILSTKRPAPALPAVMPATTTFRNAIHEYLDRGHQHWSKLGIDLLLGKPTDAVMTTGQQQFLPENLMMALDQAKDVKIVAAHYTLAHAPEDPKYKDWFTPTIVFGTLLAVFIFVSFTAGSRTRLLLAGLDGIVFFSTGLLGCVIIFMMTSTDHSMTKENFNLVWAWPTHLLASFFINSRSRLMKMYFGITALAMILVILSWFFLPQELNPALISIVFLILFRSILRWRVLNIHYDK